MSPMPTLNPIIVHRAICPECGEDLQPQVEKMANGRVTSLKYVHYPETGKTCGHFVESNMEKLNGQQQPLSGLKGSKAVNI